MPLLPLTQTRMGTSCLCPLLFLFIASLLHSPRTTSAQPSPDTTHWAFRPRSPQAPSQPNSIDEFLLKNLEPLGLTFMPEADRLTLLRRVTYDTTGLPPTQEAVDQFLNDPRPDAYTQLVERSLTSPHFGERWAQHWLDVIRFAETDGFEFDQLRPNAWKYRDWVIDALNQNLPYDHFIRYQIAGDLEEEALAPEQAIATGFLMAGPDMPDINLQEERRHEFLNDLTSTLGTAILGMGLGCAQCHDHKFDPITQRDFYRFRTYFSNLMIPKKGQSLDSIYREDPSREWVDTLALRGDFRRPGEKVTPGFPVALEFIPRVAPDTRDQISHSAPRLQLAQWLTHPNHPLTARVIVNRIWHPYFGEPIVGTPNDFGTQGEAPRYPELLDWLASELVRRNWNLKEIHSLILHSQAYRQSARPIDLEKWRKAKTLDPDNQLLSRMNRKRLDAEALRDTLLAVSGRLNLKQGGPGIRPPLPPEVAATLLRNQWEITKDTHEHLRRSIYLFQRRNLRYPFLEVFDRPDTNVSCARRLTSTTSPQALTLFNSGFVWECATHMASLILKGEDKPQRVVETWPQPSIIDKAFLLAFQRYPNATEREYAQKLLKETRTGNETFLWQEEKIAEEQQLALTALCLALLNANELIYLD